LVSGACLLFLNLFLQRETPKTTGWKKGTEAGLDDPSNPLITESDGGRQCKGVQQTETGLSSSLAAKISRNDKGVALALAQIVMSSPP
jgi:hypothetical protein